MLNERAVSIASAYWSGHFDCPVDELFSERFRVVTHGCDLAGYHGAFAPFRSGSALTSIPPDRADSLQTLVSEVSYECWPGNFASALSSVSTAVIGPAHIDYATTVPQAIHPARALSAGNMAALGALKELCDASEREHGGCSTE